MSDPSEPTRLRKNTGPVLFGLFLLLVPAMFLPNAPEPRMFRVAIVFVAIVAEST